MVCVTEDEFGPSTVMVKRNKRICAPADKNGEDPTAVTDAGHLVFYTLKQTAPRAIKVKGVTVNNQFGPRARTVRTRRRRIIPST